MGCHPVAVVIVQVLKYGKGKGKVIPLQGRCGPEVV